MPLVSVITPAYNRARFLDETIRSVLAQDYQPIEYIVIDDGSTDDTRDVLAKYADRISWYTHENVGETRTVNEGLRACKGEIIAVVNSDDPLLPGAITAAVCTLNQHPDLLAVYGDWIEIGPDSQPIKKVVLCEYDLRTLLTSPSVALGPGTFFRRRALDLIGVRDTGFKYVGDLDYWFRLASQGPLGYIPKPFATHRTHPESLSASERGRAMAAELVGLVRKTFANPEIPRSIRRLRLRALSNAHFNAALFCGGNRAARIGHHLASLAYSPALFARRAVPLAIRALLRRLPGPVYGFLRHGWHTLGRVGRDGRQDDASKGDR